MTFNQKEYINQYKKDHYSQLKVDLFKEDKQELVDICNQEGITIKQFILNAIQKAKKKQKK